MVKLNIELPASFYEEEERCGYTIPAEMKKVWAVELDLLAELMRVCRKHDIKIMAFAGTVLGAVRHGGFIPWDDDIDMMMPRSEYDRLCAVAADEFKAPYFFQTEYTDPGSMRGHAQLRNSETTAILTSEQNIKSFNQGIFVDIFPLDHVAPDRELCIEQGRRAEAYKARARKQWNLAYNPAWCALKTKRKLAHIPALMLEQVYPADRWYRKFEEECQRYNDQPSQYVGSLSFKFFRHDLWCESRYLDDVIEVPFESTTIPICRESEKMLDRWYGEWRTFVMNASFHGGTIFDTEKSYREYLKQPVVSTS